MKHILFAALVACSLQAEILFNEPFDRKLTPDWTWVRESRDAWRVGQGVLEIKIEPGNMWGPENSARNVLIRNLPESADGWEISMTVENRPTGQYEQVDLVAYFDDSHMVKLGQELVDGKLSIVMGREEADRTRTIAIIPLETARVELKMIIRSGTVTGLFRPNRAAGWRTAGSCALPRQAEPRIAIQCYQGPKDQEHWAKITDFKITKPSVNAPYTDLEK